MPRGDGKPTRLVVLADTPARREQLRKLMPKGASVRLLPGRVEQEYPWNALASGDPDVIVYDVNSPAAAEGLLELAREAAEQSGLVALADSPEIGWVTESLSLGVNAIISREATEEELGLAIEAAAGGLVLLLPSSVEQMLTRFPVGEVDDLVEPLTGREREVLAMLGDGIGNKEIAARLRISEHTVKFHISSILGKLGAETRTEAVRMGIQRGWITI